MGSDDRSDGVGTSMDRRTVELASAGSASKRIRPSLGDPLEPGTTSVTTERLNAHKAEVRAVPPVHERTHTAPRNFCGRRMSQSDIPLKYFERNLASNLLCHAQRVICPRRFDASRFSTGPGE